MSKVSLAHFWLSVETEFPHFAKKTVKVLIPFTSTQEGPAICVFWRITEQPVVSGPAVPFIFYVYQFVWAGTGEIPGLIFSPSSPLPPPTCVSAGFLY